MYESVHTLITLSPAPVTNHSFPGSTAMHRTHPRWPLITCKWHAQPCTVVTTSHSYEQTHIIPHNPCQFLDNGRLCCRRTGAMPFYTPASCCCIRKRGHTQVCFCINFASTEHLNKPANLCLKQTNKTIPHENLHDSNREEKDKSTHVVLKTEYIQPHPVWKEMHIKDNSGAPKSVILGFQRLVNSTGSPQEEQTPF